MRTSSLIGHIIQLLDQIRAGRQPADGVVREFFRSRHYLGSKDRRFISEQVYAILRNYRLLETYVSETRGGVSPGGTIPSVMVYAAFAVKVLGRDAVELLPDLSGLWRMDIPGISCEVFLNALSRVGLPPTLSDPAERIAVEHSFDASIVREWVERFGEEETGQLCSALNQQAPTVIRVNTLRCSVEECQTALARQGVRTQRTALSPFGLVLERRVNVQSLRAFTEGWFEMQDEASQLVPLLLEPFPGATIVDACAGGGGKTLETAALMQNSGSILAVDVDETRLSTIRQRLVRSGVGIVQSALRGRDEGILGAWKGKADAVLVDAPCSGVGTFRRNPGAKLLFEHTFVSAVSRTQREVLEDSARFVRAGGRLVYATCTLLKIENEEAVEEFLRGHPEYALLSAPAVLDRQGITVSGSPPFLLLLPHRHGTDGFFAAVMQREGDDPR